MTPSRSQRGKSQDGRTSRGGRRAIGIVLLVLDEPMDVFAIIQALRSRGLRPVSMPVVQDAVNLVSRWRPQAVILQASRPDALALLVALGDRGIPCVLIGTSVQLQSAERQHPSCAELLLPAEPGEIAEAAGLVVGPATAGTPPAIIDLGVLELDLRTRMVRVEGDHKVLPPREFEILAQLALRPEVPLAAAELARRVWPESRSPNVDELHTRIWRLRRLLGDHLRPQPLIVNRRGIGYLLSISSPPSG